MPMSPSQVLEARHKTVEQLKQEALQLAFDWIDKQMLNGSLPWQVDPRKLNFAIAIPFEIDAAIQALNLFQDLQQAYRDVGWSTININANAAGFTNTYAFDGELSLTRDEIEAKK